MCKHPAPGSKYPDPGNVDSGLPPQDGEHGSRGQRGSRASPSFRGEAGHLAQQQGHSVSLPLMRLPQWLFTQWTPLLDLSVLWGMGRGISIASWLSTWPSPRALFIADGLG